MVQEEGSTSSCFCNLSQQHKADSNREGMQNRLEKKKTGEGESVGMAFAGGHDEEGRGVLRSPESKEGKGKGGIESAGLIPPSS